MQRLTWLLLAAILFVAVASETRAADALTDGGFEMSTAWSPPSPAVTVNAINASQWWIGPETDTWARIDTAGYARTGNYCASDTDGFGGSGGLVQFVPVADAHIIDVSLEYVLWKGDHGETTATYTLYGWDAGDTITLDSSGPGPAATEIVSVDLVSPAFPGGADPKDVYNPSSCSGQILPNTYDYVGLWIEYEIWGGSFFVDNVSMNLSPEPGTLAVLGAGALLLIRRRRK